MQEADIKKFEDDQLVTLWYLGRRRQGIITPSIDDTFAFRTLEGGILMSNYFRRGEVTILPNREIKVNEGIYLHGSHVFIFDSDPVSAYKKTLEKLLH